MVLNYSIFKTNEPTMIKQFLVSIVITTTLLGYTDLGTYGNTKLIKEKSFDLLIQEKYQDLIIKKKLEKEIKIAYDNSFNITSSLRTCDKSVQYDYIPTIILSEDIKIPYNQKILFKKGYSYNILKENNIFFNKYLIFIDANDDIQIKLAKKYKKYADIFVVKGNIKKLLEQDINAKLARERIEIKMLKIKCLPTILTQQEYKFIINEYNPKELIKE